jgi:potassium efflux system protein
MGRLPARAPLSITVRCLADPLVVIQGLTKKLIIVLRGIALLLMLLAPMSPAGAQSAVLDTPQGAGIVATQQAVLAQLALRTDEINARIDTSSESDEKLVELRLDLEDIATELLQGGVAFRPRLAEINARLEQLGAPPAEGQPPESDIVASERKALLAEKAEINVLLGKAEDLSIRVSNMLDTVATLRSDLFKQLLTARYDLVDAFGAKTAADAQREFSQFYRSVSSWFRFVFQFKFQAVLGATFLALLAAAILLVGGRRLFGRLIEPDHSIEQPTYLSRLSVVFWSTFLPTLALGVFLAATAFFFNYFNVLRGDIGVFLQSCRRPFSSFSASCGWLARRCRPPLRTGG